MSSNTTSIDIFEACDQALITSKSILQSLERRSMKQDSETKLNKLKNYANKLMENKNMKEQQQVISFLKTTFILLFFFFFSSKLILDNLEDQLNIIVKKFERERHELSLKQDATSPLIPKESNKTKHHSEEEYKIYENFFYGVFDVVREAYYKHKEVETLFKKPLSEDTLMLQKGAHKMEDLQRTLKRRSVGGYSSSCCSLI